MGFVNKLFGTLGFLEQTDENENIEYYEEQEEVRAPKRSSGFFANNEDYDEMVEPANDNGMKIVLLQPVRFEDAQNIASYLLEDKVVVFDLQDCDVDTSLNIVNFVCGAVFALNGSIKKINDRGAIFVVVPYNVSMDNELRESFGMDSTNSNITDWVSKQYTKENFR